MVDSGTSSVIIDTVTRGQSIRMNSEVYRAIHSAYIQVNSSKVMWQHFTGQMDNNPKHTPTSN